MKAGDKAGAETLKARTAELKQHTQAAAAELAQVEKEQQQILYKLPNLPPRQRARRPRRPGQRNRARARCQT